jgi:hypothetical protein
MQCRCLSKTNPLPPACKVLELRNSWVFKEIASVQCRGNETCELDRHLWLVLPTRRIHPLRLFALSREAVWLRGLAARRSLQHRARIAEPAMGWPVRLPLRHRGGWCRLQLWRGAIVVSPYISLHDNVFAVRKVNVSWFLTIYIQAAWRWR